MTSALVNSRESDAVSRAVGVLAEGGLVVVPTDTVYGVAALPTVLGATAGLFAAKSRRADVPLAVLCASADAAFGLVDLSDPAVGRRARCWAVAHWPGPLTMVLPRRGDLDWDLGEPTTTIGVRVPDHAFVRSLAARVGPIAVTSANRHGEPTPPTAVEAAGSLVSPVGLVVDAGSLESSASTVVDVASGRVLRPGPIGL